MFASSLCYHRSQRQLLVTMDQLQRSLSGRNDSLLRTLGALSGGRNELASYYHEYDYDKDTPGNGFRSFVKIIDLFIAKFAAVVVLNNSLNRTILMDECATFANTLSKSLDVARLIRQKGLDYQMTEAGEADQEIFDRVFQFSPTDIEPLYSNIGAFFLEKSYQSQLKQNMFLLNLLSVPLLTKLRMLGSSKFAAQVQANNAINMTIRHLKTASLRQFPLNIAFRLLMQPAGAFLTWVTVARESPWVIRIADTRSAARLEEARGPRGGFVRCLLIKPSLVRDNSVKSVILFAHGGGFITGSPEAYSDFLSRAAQRVSVPVLVPDYAKAPEKPYPAALQDMMDVYQFLRSADAKVADMIGFQPEDVILSGDSAGSNLALAMTIALNRLQKTAAAASPEPTTASPVSSWKHVRMPQALFLQYPSVTGFIAVPSTTVLTVDPLLTTGFYALSRSFYAETEPRLEDELWYRRDPNKKQIIRRFNARLKDPLFNIMAFQDWHELKDIRLYVVGSEMDAILDHSILVAKKWQGPVTLDVARDMSHGFLAGLMNPAVMPVIRLCVDRMAQAVGVKT